MRIALIGNGTMGHLAAVRARFGGDDVGEIVTSRDNATSASELAKRLQGHDAVVDFSVAQAVVRNTEAALRANVPLVEGTTGWNDELPKIERLVQEYDGSIVYGANFSIGVNLFYRVVAYAARVFSGAEDYAPFIHEAHHARKRDAPSGTALRLVALLSDAGMDAVPISSTRAGHIPGTHVVGFDSSADQITLQHEARSREGFVAGALLAAHWIVGRKGIYEFSAVLDDAFGLTRSTAN